MIDTRIYRAIKRQENNRQTHERVQRKEWKKNIFNESSIERVQKPEEREEK